MLNGKKLLMNRNILRMNKKECQFSKVARIIAAIFLFIALMELPYGYYRLLRVIVCGVACYSLYISLMLEAKGWLWAFGIIAVLFNPLIPIHLTREIWAAFDIGAAVIFIISIFVIGWVLYKAQIYANIACADAAGTRNCQFTVANYLWMILSILFWALSLFGILLEAGVIDIG